MALPGAGRGAASGTTQPTNCVYRNSEIQLAEVLVSKKTHMCTAAPRKRLRATRVRVPTGNGF
jgi:hypothetical protein